MSDLLMLVLLAAAFTMAAGYVRLCDDLASTAHPKPDDRQ